MLMAAAVWIIVWWNQTNAPVGDDRQEGSFEVLAAVRLIEDRGNDGDSFRIQHRNAVHTFRLYFVDTCEKSTRFPSRLRHQATYFGDLTLDEVVAWGERAREVTLEWLRTEPFEIYTRRERVMSSDRLHAMVRFPNSQDWLCERLVRQGLVRIYTRGTTMPDGSSRQAFEGHLRQLEAAAKAARRGAWGT